MVMGWDDLAVAAAPSILDGITSIFGGSKANKAAKQSAEAQMAFQKESLQNRHTWEVADLRRAGLNPILSANSGAPGASGASYTPQSVTKDVAVGASARDNLNSASQRSLQAAQLLATNASAKASLATAGNQDSQAALNRVNATNNSMLTPGLSFQAAIDKLKADSANPLLKGVSGIANYLSSDIADRGIGSLDQHIRQWNTPTNAKPDNRQPMGNLYKNFSK